jgi:hydroxyacylglutathione hydrolase
VPVAPLDLSVRWNRGARVAGRSSEPAIQVHRASANTVILRQSLSVNYEAPFLYLLFGAKRALLLDTGATKDAAAFPLRATVDALMVEWLTAHPTSGYELIVAHSHAHGDHIAGDGQFAGRPRTVVVGHQPDSVALFFGMTDWPVRSVAYELGGRRLTVIGIPGHEASSIAIYDESSGSLFTGDTVYPGRLYVRDAAAYAESLERLCEFADGHPVTAVLGAHIEASTRPRHDYPLGSTWHPREADLPMTVAQLREVRDAAVQLRDRPGAHPFATFALWNGPCRGATAVQRMRNRWALMTRGAFVR